MPRIGPAAIPHDGIRPFGQEIDDFPLPFIAPLQPDDARILLLQRYHGGSAFQRFEANTPRTAK
jgi:hypothetical protein